MVARLALALTLALAAAHYTASATAAAAAACPLSNGTAAVPAGRLAVCKAYSAGGKACCSAVHETAAVGALLRSALYAGGADACKTALLGVSCDAHCNPNQAGFVAGGGVVLCAARCAALHAACGAGWKGTVATWCAQAAFSWTNTSVVHKTTVSASGCLGSVGCEQLPDSGTKVDECGACNGTSACNPGAATIAGIRANLTAQFGAQRDAGSKAVAGVGATMSTLAARVGSQQAAATAQRKLRLNLTSAEHAKAKAAAETNSASAMSATKAVGALLAAAQASAAADSASLDKRYKVAAAAVAADSQRVQAAHKGKKLLQEAELQSELRAWAAANAKTTAALNELKSTA